MRRKGIESIGIDFERNPQKPKAPIVCANLSTDEGQTLVQEMDDELQFAVVHAAPPCGTASRARERPLPKRVTALGISTPRPLRSNAYPWGLPGLNEHDQMKVDCANRIYRFVALLCIQRHKDKRFFSIENPKNSYLWQLDCMLELMAMPGVRIDEFSQCAHGGDRPVMRRWVSNMPMMVGIRAQCPGVSGAHVHLPFGATRTAGKVHFATAEEAKYPTKLCNRLADIVATELTQLGYRLTVENLHDIPDNLEQMKLRGRALGGKFVRGDKLPPLVQEFGERIQCVVDENIQPGSNFTFEDGSSGRVLRRTGVQEGEHTAVVGKYLSPKQFVDRAWEAKHPIDLPSFLPQVLLNNIFWLLTTPQEQIRTFRTEAVREMRELAAQLMQKNRAILDNMSDVEVRIHGGKNLALLKHLVEEMQYPDRLVVQSIIDGVNLVGEVQRSSIYQTKINPASMKSSDLLKNSARTRAPIIKKIAASGDDEVDLAVWEETQIEIQKGWLGPPMSEEQMIQQLGSSFTVARRFGIKQNGKIRTIDDYAEPSVNATVTTFEKIDLFSTDELFSVMRVISTAVKEDGSVCVDLPSGEKLCGRLPQGVTTKQARQWLGKSYDLESAYRQLSISARNDNEKFAVIGVYDPTSKSYKLCRQYAAPFGAVSSVYYFNRAARVLWAVLAYRLRLVWTNYFDDYPCLDPLGTSENADINVKAVFALLGWGLSTNPKKTKPFLPQFETLGVVADLAKLPEGTATFTNKPNRVEELSEQISQVLAVGRCPQPLMASLRGRAQYAAAQVFGRVAVGPLHVLARHETQCKSGLLDEETKSALVQIKEILVKSPPRMLSTLEDSRPLLLFTDGAVEGTSKNVVTAGAVMIDTASDFAQMWGMTLPHRLVKAWKLESGNEQVVGQAEIFPILISRIKWKEKIRGRRVLAFIDNDSARHALVRGWSPSPTSRRMLNLILQLELSDASWWWYSRVSTHSNCADAPSRLKFEASEENDFADVVGITDIPQELFPSSITDLRAVSVKRTASNGQPNKLSTPWKKRKSETKG